MLSLTDDKYFLFQAKLDQIQSQETSFKVKTVL